MSRDHAKDCRRLLRMARAHARLLGRVESLLSGGGMEAGALARACRSLAAAEGAITGLAKTAPEGADAVALREAVGLVAAGRARVAELLAVATSPRTPPDPAVLAQTEADFAAGRVASGDDVIAELLGEEPG